MNKILIIISVSLMTLLSCDKDDYVIDSDIPLIRFESLAFKAAEPRPETSDSLILKFYVEDRDFDLALKYNWEPPFNRFNYYLKSTGKAIPSIKTSDDQLAVDTKELITLKDRKKSPYDTLPDFVKPFNCTNYEVVRILDVVKDTVYHQSNKYFDNIWIDVYTVDDQATTKYNFTDVFNYPVCDFGWNWRIEEIAGPKEPGVHPVIFETLGNNRGIMTYKIYKPRSVFGIMFKGKRIKLKIRILDRAHHISNEIETSTLQF